MSKAAFDAKLAALESLKSAGPEPQRDAALSKGIGDRNNFVAAKAARVAGEVLARSVAPALLAAFDRFMNDPVKSDPQCWAKTAIVKALAQLGHEDPDVYVRGLRHEQMEAVWGGREDTAGPLRVQSISALTGCRSVRDLDLLEYLIDPLFDRDKTVRAETARALGRVDRREAGLILRARALAGDAEPEPLGAIYSAILGIEGRRGIPFVGRFLDAGGDPAQEAALALGETHEPAAVSLLRAALDRAVDPGFRTSLMAAMALTRLPEAIDFLIGQVRAGSREAEQALKDIPLPEDQRVRLQEALAGRS